MGVEANASCSVSLLLLRPGGAAVLVAWSGVAARLQPVLGRKRCEPVGLFPQRVLPSLRDGRYAAAVAAAPGRVRVLAARA